MPQPLTPRQYLTKEKLFDVYDIVNNKIKYIGERMIYKYYRNNKRYIIRKNGKAYELGVYTLDNNRRIIVIKPNGDVLT